MAATALFNVQDVVAVDIISTINLQNLTLSWVVIDGSGKRRTFTPTVQSTALTDSSGNQLAAAYYWCQYTTTATDFPASAAGNATGQLVAGGVSSNPWNFVIGGRL